MTLRCGCTWPYCKANSATSIVWKAAALEALKITRSAADALGALAREHPLLVQVRIYWGYSLSDLSSILADLGRYAEAEQSARSSIEVSEALRREVPSSSFYRHLAGHGYLFLGKALLKAGSHGEALAMLRKSITILETSDPAEANASLAWALALASTVADSAEGPAAAQRQRRDADRAVATIRRLIGMGWADSEVLRNDPDLGSLRSRPDFQALMMDLAFPTDPFAPSE